VGSGLLCRPQAAKKPTPHGDEQAAADGKEVHSPQGGMNEPLQAVRRPEELRLISNSIVESLKGYCPDMETIVVESQILAYTYEEVQRRFTGLDDPAHGWEHVNRVYKLALHIAEREGADRFIVGMAALMHDLGRLEQSRNEEQHHVDVSIALASELLNTYQLAPEIQQAILHAIEAHSFSKGVQPQTREAQVLRDADRLDALGAIGILRWAITGTIRRTPQTRTYHPDDPFAEKHIPDDHSYMLDHFYTKLLKLSDTMVTETGRAMARRRTDFMRTYLAELRNELEV